MTQKELSAYFENGYNYITTFTALYRGKKITITLLGRNDVHKIELLAAFKGNFFKDIETKSITSGYDTYKLYVAQIWHPFTKKLVYRLNDCPDMHTIYVANGRPNIYDFYCRSIENPLTLDYIARCILDDLGHHIIDPGCLIVNF